MVDAEGVAHDVPALSERDPQHEPGDQHQREDPARGRVWRPFVQVVLVQPTNTGAYSLDEARLCYGLAALQHILHHPRGCFKLALRPQKRL